MLILFAVFSLWIGSAAVAMAFVPAFKSQWLYFIFVYGKRINWFVLSASCLWVFIRNADISSTATGDIVSLAVMALGVLMSYRIRDEYVFEAVDYPDMASDPFALPLEDDTELALVEFGGVTKAYPLRYVAHHHIVNDRFGDKAVAIVYCPMCHSVIPMDITELGPLFVAAINNANMVVADRKTRTWFQQATLESMYGELHPHSVDMVPYQIVTWGELKVFDSVPSVVDVTEHDLRDFELPIPGVWKKIINSELTPSLSSKKRDKTFPARTRVIGILDKRFQPSSVYLKSELLEHAIVFNEQQKLFLVSNEGTVKCFSSELNGQGIALARDGDKLRDTQSGTIWTLSGHYVSGTIKHNLSLVTVSDEYWFSWKLYHSESELVRL
jgi:hypothetical protein